MRREFDREVPDRGLDGGKADGRLARALERHKPVDVRESVGLNMADRTNCRVMNQPKIPVHDIAPPRSAHELLGPTVAHCGIDIHRRHETVCSIDPLIFVFAGELRG